MRTLSIILFLFYFSGNSFGQQDTTSISIKLIPGKYLNQVEKKIGKYTNRVSSKTEKTLTKLAKWELKIKKTLTQANPEVAQQLFSNPEMTFNGLLEKLHKGEQVVQDYQAQYNQYRDELKTNVDYLISKKEELDTSILIKVKTVRDQINQLNDGEKQNEYIQKFIAERRKQLLDEGFKALGNNSYLQKINKETFYYIESLRNYKAILNDPTKAEETAKRILNSIPAFQQFFKQNSLLSSLFGVPDNYASASMEGLQTRSSIMNLLQEKIASGGPNAMDQLQKNIQAAQQELKSLKNKMLQQGIGNSSEINDPNFKPNMQKTKTLLQRLEFGTNLQFARNNSFMPGTADIGLSVGYKFNDRFVMGVGGSYKLGMGTIENIHFTTEGVGLRSFTDWKIKKGFFLSGGFEMNYYASPIAPLEIRKPEAWQKAGLMGISKKVNIKTKWFKGGKIQLLYDFLSQQHIPVSQPLLFRVGYEF